MTPRRAALGLATLAWGAAFAAETDRAVFPIALDHAFVRQRLVEQLFAGPDETGDVLRDASGCSQVVLSRPAVSGREGRVEVTTSFSATLGAGVGGRCLGALGRKGTLRADLEPALAAGARHVGFRVVDSSLLGPEGERGLDSALWNLVKERVHPHLAAFRVDLARPLGEVAAFLPVLLPAREREAVERGVATLAIEAVEATAETLTLRVGVQLPRPAPRAVSEPEPPWTPERIARWQAGWQGWDALLTFVVKRGGRDADAADRRELLAILLDARHELLEVLAAPPSDAPDPVPALFLHSWERLAPVLRRLSGGLPGESALQYASFIAAADALAALERLGPGHGVELSSDGLRRLAAMLEPSAPAEASAYSEAVDPELRALFGFAAEPGAGDASQAAPEPPPPPLPPVPHAPLSHRSRPWLALASVGVERHLDAWLPSRAELPIYLPRVRDVLAETAVRTRREQALPARYAALFRQLMLATAWQESCWRQYTQRAGAPATLTSRAGALGIMQVNPHVWRGLYAVAKLRDNLRYNAAAGSEILHHYLVDYALARKEHEARGRPDDLARATYAAYNAGPRQLTRYRRPVGEHVGHRVDRTFFEKFEAVRAGRELAVASCFPGLELEEMARL